MFGLQRALQMLVEEEGLDAAFNRHRLLADAVRAAVSAWGENGLMELNITSPEARANSVTAVRLAEDKQVSELLDWCEHTASVKLGITIGELNNRGFRIGHMGYVNAPMVMGVLGVVETALHALQWYSGSSGVAAAADVLGRSLQQ